MDASSQMSTMDIFNRMVIQLSKCSRDIRKIMYPDSNVQIAEFIENFRSKHCIGHIPEILLKSNDQFSDLIVQGLVFSSFHAWLRYHRLPPDDPKRSVKRFTLSLVPNLLPSDFLFRYLFIDVTNKPTSFIENIQCKKLEPVYQTARYIQVIEHIDDAFGVFYSLFLNAYDSKVARDMGVNYTPTAIVDFMVRGMDYFLKHEFNISEGLLHGLIHGVPDLKPDESLNLRIIEPAAGTLAFPIGMLKFARSVIAQSVIARSSIFSPNNGGQQNNILISKMYRAWIENFFLLHLHAFEILPIPYTFGRMNTYLEIFDTINLPAIEVGITSKVLEEKLHYFLTNSITDPARFEQLIEYDIKNPPNLVIFGNPPYNINTQNDSDWLRSLLEDYKVDLNEKNLKILSDDYVKFIRVAQWTINKSGRGMIVFITNNNYLDGAVFRIMRKSLLESFNKIYIADLHGNMRKGEGSNPFGIKVGVAIIFAIRTNDAIGPNKCSVHYLDVNGLTLEEKYSLLNQSFTAEAFRQIPITPDYFFIPRNCEEEERYHKFICIKDLFLQEPKSGIMSGRDSLVSNADPELLKQNIDLFFKHDFDFLDKLGVEVSKTKNWDPEVALKKSNKENSLKRITRYNYRGFDVRYLVYDPALVEGSRMGYISIISKDNPAIATTRSIRADHFSHALITRYPCEKCYLAVKDSSYVFLLKCGNGGTEFNLNLSKVPFPVQPEDLFYYIYGILSSNLYRQRYQVQLKRNFARIPFPHPVHTKEIPVEFNEMTKLGRKIASIHMDIDNSMQPGEITFGDTLDKRIINPVYLPAHQLLVFNYPTNSSKSVDLAKKSPEDIENLKKSGMWVSGISEEMWRFEIGSIPQIQNWLVSRKFVDPIKEVHDYQKDKTPRKRHIGLRRGLNSQDFQEFINLCIKIKRTIEMMPELDSTYAEIDRDI